jgi:8-oxo-dGTP pyrophosphatase MutT (NUDIX family)
MIDVAWAVLRQGDRYLLAQRSIEDSAGGTWTFPGGKADPTDTDIIATIKRKLKKELGISGQRFRKILHMRLDQYWVQVFFCDRWLGELRPACSDIIGLGWFTCAEMYALDQSLAPFANDSLLYLSYLVQHYDHHPDEWREPWRECIDSGKTN